MRLRRMVLRDFPVIKNHAQDAHDYTAANR